MSQITTEDVVKAGEMLADVLGRAVNDLESFAETEREDVRNAAEMMADAVRTGNYDNWKFGVAVLIMCDLFPGGRKRWTLMDGGGDLLWRVTRDTFKKAIAQDVDRFLEDALGD